jgi:DNA-binding CsgD family transcriptional regulator/tetratricopeptide (TPR) repeat protein
MGVEVPLRPLREALLTAARAGRRPSAHLTPFLPALGTLVPDWAEPVSAGADKGAIVLAEGLLRLLTEWSAPESPALLVVEDVHWADPETLGVLEYLADHLVGQPCLLVVTAREDETGPGSEMIQLLTARRAATALDVRPLGPGQSESVLRECLGVEAVPVDLLDAVVDRSDGIPFFIEELLATALAGPTGRVVPASIGVALETRFASLPEPVAEFVRYAAVMGRQFDWRVVAAALGCAPADAVGKCRQAARAQLIDPDSGGFRFRHALTVDAVQATLLPEEHQYICDRLWQTLDDLHPDLEGELCQLAANLADGAGNSDRAAALWLKAARRALREGSLGSAEVLALRANGTRPVEADRVLLSTWALAGQPQRAAEAGRRILASAADPVVQWEVRFDLIDAMIDAGRWDDAESYLKGGAVSTDRSHMARRAIGEAEVALGRNDRKAALAFARDARAVAAEAGLSEVTCRALWLIGRVERGRDTAAAAAVFEEAHRYAAQHGLGVYRTRALFELGTIDMFETLATGRLEEARQLALESGALSTVAAIDLQLAATYSCRGQAAQTLEAAARASDVSRRLGLSSLPHSLALQAVAHGFSGNWAAMEEKAAAARKTRSDRDTVEINILGSAVALYHLGNGQLDEALVALDGAMEILRRAGGGVRVFPGRWALLRTVVGDRGADAREECRALEFDTAMSRATLWAADAVAAGREGGDAGAVFAEADRALSRFEGGFLRSVARLVVAPCADQDGWGDPAAWLREALTDFDHLDLPNYAAQCRSALRAMGEPVPRRARLEAAHVPGPLAAQGVTAREVEVMAQVIAGRTNRQIAQSMHLSVRTVEKHVEHLLMKTGCTRAALADWAAAVGVPAAD